LNQNYNIFKILDLFYTPSNTIIISRVKQTNTNMSNSISGGGGKQRINVISNGLTPKTSMRIGKNNGFYENENENL
jgi:hypothetical protein